MASPGVFGQKGNYGVRNGPSDGPARALPRPSVFGSSVLESCLRALVPRALASRVSVSWVAVQLFRVSAFMLSCASGLGLFTLFSYAETRHLLAASARYLSLRSCGTRSLSRPFLPVSRTVPMLFPLLPYAALAHLRFRALPHSTIWRVVVSYLLFVTFFCASLSGLGMLPYYSVSSNLLFSSHDSRVLILLRAGGLYF